ncbi:MAG TPA: ABC transporter ATP-binding protein [Methanosarcinales archaeon]|nr:ABC transporter ATP-binding protein [Methanosarcinales archaeon]
MNYAIETFGLTKRFARTKGFIDLIHPLRRKEITAIEDVNLKIKKGELFGVLGPNGAGKTTLIKMLCTLILPTSGTASVNGYDIVDEGDKVRASIGLVTGEERSFYWRLSGRQNLMFFASLHGFSSSDAHRKVDELLDIVDMTDKADDRFHNYSTGIKQRMAIARGLLNDPDMLFMDEPTKSLDPDAARHLQEFSRRLAKDQKKTVFLSTHHLDEAEHLCDRIMIIDRAKVRTCGSLSEIREKMGDEVGYILEVRRLSDEMQDKLSNMDGVIDLSTHVRHDVSSLEIRLSDGETVLPQIIDAIVEGGGRIQRCEIDEISLDSVFARIIDGGDDKR